QSALFNFESLLLTLCTCAYWRAQFPSLVDRNKTGYDVFWKAARIGERLSP
ncbi:hypothetical protein BJ742DRAFT_664660, partial [Cladochytrium replicatum]